MREGEGGLGRLKEAKGGLNLRFVSILVVVVGAPSHHTVQLSTVQLSSAQRSPPHPPLFFTLRYLRGNLVDPALRSFPELRLAWPTAHAGLASLTHERHELLELKVEGGA